MLRWVEANMVEPPKMAVGRATGGPRGSARDRGAVAARAALEVPIGPARAGAGGTSRYRQCTALIIRHIVDFVVVVVVVVDLDGDGDVDLDVDR
jgi:hypothetical protein